MSDWTAMGVPPASILLPLALGALIPLLAWGMVTLAGRRRGVGLATRLAARAAVFMGLGFTVMTGVASLSVLSTGLRELHDRHTQNVVGLARRLDEQVLGPGAAASRSSLALFRAGRPAIGFAAVTLANCRTDCFAVVTESGLGLAEAQRLRGVPEPRPGDHPILELGGSPFLLLSSALRGPTGLPRGTLLVGVDAQGVVVQAEQTAWLLVAIGYVLLLMTGLLTHRILAASVARRVQELIARLETPGRFADDATHREATADELALLAGSLERTLRRLVARERESEERFRRLVEFSPDGIVVHNGITILFINRAGLRLAGVAELETILGRPLADLLDLPSHDSVHTPVPGHTVPLLEGHLIRRDRTRLDVEVAEIPFTFQGQAAVQAVIRDIGARKHAEESLRRSEETYRTLVKHATHGIYLSDLQGRFLAVNPALVRILGYDSEQELLAADLAMDVYRDPAERPVLVERYRHADRVQNLEVEWRRKDGAHITVRLNGQPVRGAGGQLEGFEMIAEDVTERRTLEEQLRQAQKMEAVGRLTGGIAHDFNNLLTVIIANADILASGLPQGDEDLRKDLDDLRAAARRGGAMVRKLLAFSRSDRLEMKALDLGTLVAEMSYLVRRVLPENIDINLPEKRPGSVVRADGGAIEQILLNLATNARDAMPHGGRLTIGLQGIGLDEAFCQQHGWGRPGAYVCLWVGDTGHGMDEATKARIFDPFFTTKSPEAGTGLGMAMVYGLVRQHGGFIGVESEEDGGTIVRVYLPAVAEAAEAIAERGASGLRGGQETIMLVEDEEAIRRTSQRVLERYGYRVLTASNGLEALEIFRTVGSDVDLVVSDLMMPRLTGRQLFERLRGEGHTPPFLFISGYAKDSLEDIHGLDGGIAFLNKPWTVAELVLRVREVLDAQATAGVARKAS